MKSPPANYTHTLPAEEDDDNQEIPDIETSVRLVENLLKYSFKDKKLLEEALTHSSYTESASYNRLEFVGDVAVGLAISNYFFFAYPHLESGKLTHLRAANVSTEKLARVAVRHQLYKFVRHNATALFEKVKEFVVAVQQEDELEVYGGLIKAPKVLADIVESVTAAVYIDCNLDLKAMWMIIKNLLEPIVMLDYLEQQPQPVKRLFELCQKDGKHVAIRHWKNGEKHIASVYVDELFVASASSEQKKNANLHAAKAALQKLSFKSSDTMMIDMFSQLNADNEIEGAKQKLHDLCGKRKWSKPKYKIQEEVGRAHEKKYVCSVVIAITEHDLFVKGNVKSRLKDAENSAASAMLLSLKESKYL